MTIQHWTGGEDVVFPPVAGHTVQRLVELADTTCIFQNRKSYTGLLANNAAFHLAIARASDNSRMVESIGQIMEQLNRVFHLSLDLRDRFEEMCAEHQTLAAADG